VGAGLGKAVAPGKIVISGGCSTIGAVGVDVGEGEGMAVAPGKGLISGGKNTIAAVGVDVGGDVKDGVRITTPTMGVGAGVIVRTALGEAVGRVVASIVGSLCGEDNPIAGVGAVVVAPLSTCGVWFRTDERFRLELVQLLGPCLFLNFLIIEYVKRVVCSIRTV
jgi:hypothetical protein